MKVRIGTRGSKLALWQAEYVSRLLKQGGLEPEIITIDTRGDQRQDVAIAAIGEKGVFTQAIEQQLAEQSIDIAVHSAKDLQSQLEDGFEIIAFTEREKVNDVMVSHEAGIQLNTERALVIGTSSMRRRALLKHYYPQHRAVDMRGNLQTRLRKMKEGQCDVMLLAFAGIHRMGNGDLIREELPTEQFTPAVGQGSVAVEVHESVHPDLKAGVKQAVNHVESASRLYAERAFLKTLRGGCSIPSFALATLQNNNQELFITGGIVSLNGQVMLRRNLTCPVGEAAEAGKKLGEQVLENGGDSMLKEIREELDDM